MILIKTKKEIDYIRASCKIVAEVLQLLKKSAEVGVTTIELDKIAEDYMLSKGAKPAFKGYRQYNTPPFPGSICASIDDEVVHGIPGQRKLKAGQILSIDVGVLKDGYYGDAALSVAIGEISSEKAELMKTTEESLYLGIEQAVEGNRVHDISNAVQVHCESRGFSVVRDLSGHGVGKYLHEDPAIPNFGKKGTGAKLKSGMTLAIEPMINLGNYEVKVAYDGWTIVTKDGKASAHFEHTILVNDKKPEILTVC